MVLLILRPLQVSFIARGQEFEAAANDRRCEGPLVGVVRR